MEGLATPTFRDSVSNVLEDRCDHSYAYGACNRWVASENTATGLLGEYAYNAQGQMTTFKATQPSVSTQTLLYLHDEQGKLLGTYEVVGSGVAEPQEELVYLDGWRMVTAIKDFHLTPPNLHPVLTDHLFTPRKVLDPGTAFVRWNWEHRDPFGSTAPSTPSWFWFDHRFPGQRYNFGSGLLHNGFRDYSPYIGAYLQSDPLGLEAGWNTFTYVGGDPVNGWDPWGLEIAYANHPVLGSEYHSKIVIVPENQAAYINDDRFRYNRHTGKLTATIGAGSENMKLIAGVNRDRDFQLQCMNWQHLSLPSRYGSEEEAIEALFVHMHNYNSNPVPYMLYPSNVQQYNSNSFIHGLGRAAGFEMPAPNQTGARTPGYGFPIPASLF